MPIRKELRHFYSSPERKLARAACRERAGNKCEQCRIVNDPKAGCGASYLNNTPGDERPENLKWLCRRCNLHRSAARKTTHTVPSVDLSIESIAPETIFDAYIRPMIDRVFGREG